MQRYPSEGAALLALELGRSRCSLQRKAHALGLVYVGRQDRTPRPGAFVPSANRTREELLCERAEEYKRKQAHHLGKTDVRIRLRSLGPFAIALCGDPHVDDAGTDLDGLAWFMAQCREHEHVYPICMGDLTNNWVGRLKALYAHQASTDDEATELMEWMLDDCPWSFVILGNHDKWGPLASYICQSKGIPYASHGARIKFECPETNYRYVVDARHSHRGNSMYAAEHGQNKQVYRGIQADLVVGAHTHVSASAKRKNGVSGTLHDAVRVGAWKRYDDYAESQHFDHDDVGPYCLVVVDPRKEGTPGMAVVHWDFERAMLELSALRST